MSVALNEPKWVGLYLNTKPTSKLAPQVERNYWFWKIVGDQLPMESPIELKDNAFVSDLDLQYSRKW